MTAIITGTSAPRRPRALLRANPLAVLSIGLFSLLGALFIRDLRTGLVALAVYLVVGALTLPTWRYPLICLALASITGLTVTYATWRSNGGALDPAGVQGVRVLVIAWPGAAVVGSLDLASLGDHLVQSLRLPARLVAAFAAALQRTTDLASTWGQLERSRRARGLGAEWRHPVRLVRWSGSMAFALLVHALRGASRTSVAMDARGFATASGRTWAEPATWTRTDVVVVLVAVLLGLVAPVTSWV